MSTTLCPALLLIAVPGCIVGNADSDPPLSYDEFVARYIGVHVDPSTGKELYYYDWDQPLASRDQVERLYAAYVDAKTGGELVSEATVNVTLFGLDVWSRADRVNLTYCVSNTFGAHKGTVVNALARASSDWSIASGGAVRFAYRGEYDAGCTTSAPVTFNVIPIDQNSGLFAQAFFPSNTRADRQLLINVRNALAPNPGLPFEGVLRHELGHVLGLRHETARLEAVIAYGQQCFENLWLAPLTVYDAYSVMVTPACVGNNLKNTTLSISAGDVYGIRTLYW